jgi:hypothetical protein
MLGVSHKWKQDRGMIVKRSETNGCSRDSRGSRGGGLALVGSTVPSTAFAPRALRSRTNPRHGSCGKVSRALLGIHVCWLVILGCCSVDVAIVAKAAEADSLAHASWSIVSQAISGQC